MAGEDETIEVETVSTNTDDTNQIVDDTNDTPDDGFDDGAGEQKQDLQSRVDESDSNLTPTPDPVTTTATSGDDGANEQDLQSRADESDSNLTPTLDPVTTMATSGDDGVENTTGTTSSDFVDEPLIGSGDEIQAEPDSEPEDTTDSATTEIKSGVINGINTVNTESKIDSEDVETKTATGTTEVVNSVAPLVNDNNYYQFSRQSCVPVGDGSYHCTLSDAPVVDTQAVVYSELTESGSKEIFIKTARGKVEQLTDNQYDDSSPQYDPESQRIVWQRLIDGRYQIILYDLNDRSETQLTFSRTNNMEPAVSQTGVVWQSWDGTDWEIMYFDGNYTDQITSNETQDLAPKLESEYIIWTVVGDGAQYAQVYSTKSKEIMTITNHEGGAIVNPRFVLVYDTKFDNGDIVTQGFDPETGFSAPISAKPAPEPIDIPAPDPVGEIRALIQNKSTSKEMTDVSDAGQDGNNNTPTVTGSGDDSVLDLKQQLAETEYVDEIDTLPAITADTGIDKPSFVELDEYDLVIPPIADTVEVGTSTPATVN